MSIHRMVSRARGLTLPEMLVVLLVAGVAVVVAGRMVSRTTTQSTVHHDQSTLERARDALIGHATAHLRLPAAPDHWLPEGLAGNLGSNRIRYFVSPALVDVPSNRFDPHALLARAAGQPANGLDVCQKLAALKDADLVTLGQGGDAQRVAIVLEYSSSGPTASSPEDVALPGTPLAAQRYQQGRVSLGVGPGELFSALKCPDRISRTAATAKYQWAMQDMHRLAQTNTALKRYDLAVGLAQNAATELGFAQLLVVQIVIAMDFVNYQLAFLGSLPKADYLEWVNQTVALTSYQITNGLMLGILQDTLGKWPATKAKLDAAIELAMTQESTVRQALDDAGNEHLHFQKLGFTR